MAIALSNIVNVLAVPTEVFRNIKTAPKWLIAFLVICAVSLICGYYMLPFTQKIMEVTFTSKMSEEQIEQLVSTVTRYRMFLFLLVPIPLLIKWFFITLLLYLGAILFDAQENRFKTIYAVVVHTELILLLMGLINLLILHIKGLDTINNTTDLQGIIGLEYFLAEESQNVPLATLLNNFNIFSLWYIATLTIGMSVICRLKKWESAVLVSSVWFLCIGVQFAFSLLSENMQHMMGR
jgi:hypothetical protein